MLHVERRCIVAALWLISRGEKRHDSQLAGRKQSDIISSRHLKRLADAEPITTHIKRDY